MARPPARQVDPLSLLHLLPRRPDRQARVVTTSRTIEASRPTASVRRAIVASGMPEAGLDALGVKPDYFGTDVEVWRYYDGAAGGETRFFATRLKNMAARVNLLPMYHDPAEAMAVPDKDQGRVDLVRSLKGPQMTQPQLVAQAAALFSLVGHARLLGMADPDTGAFGWEVVSTREVIHSGTRWQLQRARGGKRLELPPDAMVSWLWRPGLANSMDPDTPVKVALPILRMIERLHLSLSSIAESRLTGAGILLIAKELDRRAPEDGKPVYSFGDELEEVMMGALSDQGTAAGRVPITVELPAEMVEHGVKYVDLSKKSDEFILQYLDHFLRRLARAYDLPDEVLAPDGTSHLNHWSAWYVGEQEYRAFFAPLMEQICAALTRGWYHPILRDNGIDIDGLVIGFDASDVMAKADETDKAVKLRAAEIINVHAAAEMAGVDPDNDTPASEDFDTKRVEMLDLARSGGPLAGIMLPRLGYQLDDVERAALLGLPSSGTALSAPPALPSAPGVTTPQDTQQAPPNQGQAPLPPEQRGQQQGGPPSANPPVTASAGAADLGVGLNLGEGLNGPKGPSEAEVAAVCAVIDAACWSAWRTAANRASNWMRRSGFTGLAKDGVIDLGVLTAAAKHADRNAATTALFAGCWEVADRQLLELLASPAKVAAAGRLMRQVAVTGFFRDRPKGVRIVATEDVRDVIGGGNINCLAKMAS